MFDHFKYSSKKEEKDVKNLKIWQEIESSIENWEKFEKHF